MTCSKPQSSGNKSKYGKTENTQSIKNLLKSASK